MTSIPTRKIEMSTEQKQDIHFGTCTVKGDMVACLATPCIVRSSWFANSQAAEIERLTGCLEKANIQAEKFEREWYLRGDENEALKAERDGLLMAISARDSILRQYSAAHAAKVEKS